MLTLSNGRSRQNRRTFLTIGGLALGGLSLQQLFAADAAAREAPASPLKGKSVIFLFQQGGPSQLETFDPKLEAPSGIRTLNGAVQTSVTSLIFGGTMTRLAKLANRVTVVRSFQTNNAGHNIRPIVGPDSLETNIGVHYARIAGTTRRSSGMPTNAILYPAAVDEGVPGPQARGKLNSTGAYGSALAPFVPGSRGQLQSDMELRLPHERFFGDRKMLLERFDRLNRQVDSSGQLDAMDELRAQAYQLLLGGGVSTALDLSNEDPKTLARYDTSDYARADGWSRAARGKRGYYSGQAKTIGKLLLMARRLCEAGCGFVTIHAGYAGVWDMHADGNNLNMVDGMEAVGRSFDHAIAAFIEDVEERGLSDRIMLVATGEMGRTPRINKRGGRDHWARLAPLLIYGGGARGGQVIGQSTRDGGQPVSDNLTPKHLISSILHTTLDIGRLRIMRGAPPSVLKLGEHPPIPGIGS